MITRARLNTSSYIHKSWRLKALLGGQIHGVHFKLTTARDYVAEDIAPDKLNALLVHPDLTWEMLGHRPVIEGEPIEEDVFVPEQLKAIEAPKPRGRPRKYE